MDPRKTFVLGTLAGAIAPPDQKAGDTKCMLQSRMPLPTTDLPLALQDAYIQYLAEDSTGALAKFLDDPSCSVLSVCVRNTHT
jgi:hypothetical protein